MKTWADISSADEFKALSNDDKKQAAEYFFNQHVKPSVAEDDLQGAQTYFMEKSGYSFTGEQNTIQLNTAQEDDSDIFGRIADIGIDLAKGAVNLGQSAVGVGSMVTGGYFGEGMRYLGYNPEETNAFLRGLYSDSRKIEEEEIGKAKGFSGTAKALLSNPTATAGKVLESIPSLLTGIAAAKYLAAKTASAAYEAAIARGILKAEAEKLAAAAATSTAIATASVSEGAMQAGHSFDTLNEKGVELGRNYIASIASGTATAAISFFGGKLGTKLGIGDIDAGVGSNGNIVTRLGKGAAQEGFVEEMPQSGTETIIQNWAEKKVLTEGVGEAMATGLVVGGIAGGGANVFIGGNNEMPDNETETIESIATQDDANKLDAQTAKVPEPASTIALQLLEMTKGKKADGRRGVFIADGTNIPNIPDDMQLADVDGGKLIVWQGKDGDVAVDDYNNGDGGYVLGYGTNEKPIDTAHLTTQVMVDGKIAKQVVGSSHEIMAEANRTAEQLGGKVSIVGTEDSLQHRIGILKEESLQGETGLAVPQSNLPAQIQEQETGLATIPMAQGEVVEPVNNNIQPQKLALPAPEMTGVFAVDESGNTSELSQHELNIIEKNREMLEASGEIAVDPQGGAVRLSKGVSAQLEIYRQQLKQAEADNAIRAEHAGMNEVSNAVIGTMDARKSDVKVGINLPEGDLGFVEQLREASIIGGKEVPLAEADAIAIDRFNNEDIDKKNYDVDGKGFNTNAVGRIRTFKAQKTAELIARKMDGFAVVEHNGKYAIRKDEHIDAELNAKALRSQKSSDAARERKKISPSDSLEIFVRKHGGVSGGDFIRSFAAKEVGKTGNNFHGALAHAKGLPADYIAELAHEAGYISERSPQALYDALDSEVRHGIKQNTQEHEIDLAEKAQQELEAQDKLSNELLNEYGESLESVYDKIDNIQDAEVFYDGLIYVDNDVFQAREISLKDAMERNNEYDNSNSTVGQEAHSEGHSESQKDSRQVGQNADTARQDTLPSHEKATELEWGLNTTLTKDHDRVLKIVQDGLDDGLFYQSELEDYVSSRDKSIDGMTVYKARKLLGEMKEAGSNKEAAKFFHKGQELGTVHVGGKNLRNVTVEGVNGSLISIKGRANKYRSYTIPASELKKGIEVSNIDNIDGSKPLFKMEKPQVSSEPIKLDDKQNKPLDLHDEGSLFGQQERAEAKAKQPDLISNQQQKVADTLDKVASTLDAVVEKLNKPDAKIEDFGEKIGGAAKDMYGLYSSKMETAGKLDIATEPLSKSFPEPNYEKLIAEGADSKLVSFARVLRDDIEKPRGRRARVMMKPYVEKVESSRKLAELAIKESVNNGTAIYAAITKDLQDKVDLYEAVGHGKSLKGIELGMRHYSMYKGKEDVTFWSVETKGKTTAFSNMPRELAHADTREEAIKQFKKWYEAEAAIPPTPKGTKFNIYTIRATGLKGIGKDVGRNQYFFRKDFKSFQEARQFLNENHAEIEEHFKKWKEIPAHRKDKNNPRVGDDHRDSKDVTPEMFTEAFGFRGVEFGNWVKAKGERQSHLNRAYDALYDLSLLLKIPTTAISLNGELGLAFGARGRKGAAAHYERDNVVINITRKEGAGSLAHEWFHAMDNYISRNRKQPSEFLTGKPFKQFQDSTRTELIAAFKELDNAIRNTDMAKRANELDGRKTKVYWGEKHELSARAFESYVIDKLAKDKHANDYLANITSPQSWEAFEPLDSYPYVLDKEMKGVTKAFDNLFKTIKTKKTDKGTMLFSESESKSSGIQIEMVKRDLIKTFGKQVEKDLKSGRLVVVKNTSELPLADDAKFMVAWHGSPHDHDGFTTDRIGTGEGNQAYGYGLYFAGNKEVAEWYKDKLTISEDYVDGEPLDAYVPRHNLASVLSQESGNIEEVTNHLKMMSSRGGSKSIRDVAEKSLLLLKKGDRPKLETIKPKGKLYKVELAPKEDEYLLWDKKPKPSVISRLKKELGKDGIRFSQDNKDTIKYVRSDGITMGISLVTGGTLYSDISGMFRGDDKKASKFLSNLGIRGIKYLDGSSRGKGDGDYNYVIFNDEDVSITAKYAKAREGGKIKGAYDPETKTTYIVAGNVNQKELPSIFMHEATHAFFDSEHGKKIMDASIAKIKLLSEHGSKEDKAWIKEATDKVPDDTAAETVDEEVLAYAVQLYVDAESKNSTNNESNKLPDRIKAVAKKFMLKLKAFMARHTMYKYKFTPELLVEIVRQNIGARKSASSNGSTQAKLSKAELAEYDAVVSGFKGTPQWMKAPNGNDTNLNERQWVQVRTPSFKAWFGDWENDTSNGSLQAIDENGEPQVVYHGGLGIAKANEFSDDYQGDTTGNNEYGAFHFTDVFEVAEDYARQSFIRRFQDNTENLVDEGYFKTQEELDKAIDDAGGEYELVGELAEDNLEVKEVFVTMKNPIVEDMEYNQVDIERLEKLRGLVKRGFDEDGSMDEYIEQVYGEYNPSDISDHKDEINEMARENYALDESEEIEDYMFNDAANEVLEENGIYREETKLDGIVIRNMIDDIGDASKQYADQYILFDPEQIKSATENRGDFSQYNPDIRYSKGSSEAKVNSPEAQVEQIKEATETLTDKLKNSDAGKAASYLGSMFYFRPVQIIRDFGTPTSKLIGDLIYKEEKNESRVVEGHDLIQRRQQKTGEFVQRANDLVDAIPGKSRKERRRNQELIIQSLNGMDVKVNKTNAESFKKSAADFKQLFDDMREYQVEAGLDIGKLEHYFPRVYDIDKLIHNKKAFMKMLDDNGYNGESIWRNIVEHDGLYNLNNDSDRFEIDESGNEIKKSKGEYFAGRFQHEGGAKQQSFEKGRVLDIKYEELAPFLINELDSVMVRHIHGVTNRAEYARVFGANESELNKMVKQFAKEYSDLPAHKKQKTLKNAIADIYWLADRLQGRKVTYGSLELERYAQHAKNLSVMVHLGLVTLASIPETFSPAMRGGIFSWTQQASKGLADAFRESANAFLSLGSTKRVLPKSELRRQAELFGVVSQHAMEGVMHQLFGSTTGKYTNMFMRATMLEQFTNIQRLIAFSMAKANIKLYAKRLANGAKGKKALQMHMELKDFGIKPSEAIAWHKAGASESSDFWHNALMGSQRFTQQVITTPNEATLSKVMRNPIGGLVFQFKSFITVYSNTFLKGVIQNTARSKTAEAALRPLAPMVLMIGTAFFVQFLREAIKYEDADDPEILRGVEDMKRWYDAVDRAGFTGSLSAYYMWFNPYRYGYTDQAGVKLFNLGGAVVGDTARILDAIGSGDGDKIAKRISKMIPGVNSVAAIREPAKDILEDILD